MGAGHSHALPSTGNEKSLWLALGLTSAFLLAEVTAGFYFNSLALLSDAAHMFTDAIALAIAVAALRIARRPSDSRRTFGYYRFEILAAAFNALLLFAVAAYILFEAWQRFRQPAAVDSTGMLVVASIGLAINLISMWLLRRGKDSSLNVKGAYLEVWSDMLGSVGVIGAALLIQITGWLWLDAMVAVAIGLWVLPRTWVLLKESLNVLLEGVPDGVDLGEISSAIVKLDGVSGVHDLHVWALTSGKTSLTAHVVYDRDANASELLERLRSSIADRFDIFHTTFQLELEACKHDQFGCNFQSRSHGAPVRMHESI